MKIERAITRAVSEKRRGMKVVVYATDLVSDVYGNARPTRGQLLAVLHAMRAFVRKHRAYILAGGQGPSRLSIIMADHPRRRQNGLRRAGLTPLFLALQGHRLAL